MLGNQTRNGNMEGADESTEQWWHPWTNLFIGMKILLMQKNSSGTIKINYQFRYSHFIPSFIPSLGVRGREKRRCGVLAEWERRKIKKKKLTNWRNLVDSSSRVFLFSPLPHSAKRQPLHHSLSLSLSLPHLSPWFAAMS